MASAGGREPLHRRSEPPTELVTQLKRETMLEHDDSGSVFGVKKGNTNPYNPSI